MGSSLSAMALCESVKNYFYEDPDFAATLEQWAVDHCQEIDNSTDEMKLKYTELYNQFVEAYESKMSAFLESQGSTVNEFLEELKAVDRDGPDANFLDMMLMILNFHANDAGSQSKHAGAFSQVKPSRSSAYPARASCCSKSETWAEYWCVDFCLFTQSGQLNYWNSRVTV